MDDPCCLALCRTAADLFGQSPGGLDAEIGGLTGGSGPIGGEAFPDLGHQAQPPQGFDQFGTSEHLGLGLGRIQGASGR
jgi:hypothetical protein